MRRESAASSDFLREFVQVGRGHNTKNRYLSISLLLVIALLCLMVPQGLFASWASDSVEGGPKHHGPTTNLHNVNGNHPLRRPFVPPATQQGHKEAAPQPQPEDAATEETKQRRPPVGEPHQDEAKPAQPMPTHHRAPAMKETEPPRHNTPAPPAYYTHRYQHKQQQHQHDEEAQKQQLHQLQQQHQQHEQQEEPAQPQPVQQAVFHHGEQQQPQHHSVTPPHHEMAHSGQQQQHHMPYHHFQQQQQHQQEGDMHEQPQYHHRPYHHQQPMHHQPHPYHHPPAHQQAPYHGYHHQPPQHDMHYGSGYHQQQYHDPHQYEGGSEYPHRPFGDSEHYMH